MWGYVAEVAPDGAVALGRLDQERYDLVLTDLSMPGVSGWRVVEAARIQAPATDVVVMTGSATDDDGDRARTLDVMLLRKPFRLQELRAVIREDRRQPTADDEGVNRDVRDGSPAER